MSRVSVILVTWNSLSYLPRCFECLGRQTFSELELIVVDNGSRDGSLEWLREHSPAARVIENSENRGFCVANNQGIEAATGDYILLLNTDVFLEPDAIELLVDALEADAALGAAGPKLLRAIEGQHPTEARIDSAGEVLYDTMRAVNRGEEEVDRGEYDQREEVFGITAAAALYRRAMLEDIELEGEWLDSDFFSYLEDSDLNWRAQVQGWRFLYCPDARGLHVRQHATSRSSTIQRHAYANRYLSIVKNASLLEVLRFLPQLMVYEAFRLVKLVTRRPRMLPAYWKALRFLPRAWRKRRVVQSRRRVSSCFLSRRVVSESWLAQLAYRLGLRDDKPRAITGPRARPAADRPPPPCCSAGGPRATAPRARDRVPS